MTKEEEAEKILQITDQEIVEQAVKDGVDIELEEAKFRAMVELYTIKNSERMHDNPTSFRYACEICGNKRCPHHSDHTLKCTGSNDPGQPGSIYE